ncbi:MAG: ribonuclease H-like domain-containing protein [Armatimonadetes bacterium]|nr:ribonuclease H-like domain-containing protein [Armatimonadota bacterium]
MLQRTFIHVPGLGAHTERSLWQQGCGTWQDFLSQGDSYSIGGADRSSMKNVISKSVEALAAGRHQFFNHCLGARESWRAWPEFRKRCVYLDIETDGGQGGESITCVGLFDGSAFRCLVKHEDLSLFPDIISHYSMIVTFFGSGFDLPVLQRCFSGFHFDQIHLDLCPILRRLGYRGGLKKIERQMGITRSPETDGLTGRDAVRLWRNHMRGGYGDLDTLIAYNREDVVNLERIAQITYDRLEQTTLREAGVPHLLERQESYL